MLFMIIEHFKDDDMLPIYKRLRDQGRMLPDGLYGAIVVHGVLALWLLYARPSLRMAAFEAMQYGRIDAGIASWWGRGTRSLATGSTTPASTTASNSPGRSSGAFRIAISTAWRTSCKKLRPTGAA